ncbi:MAG: acetyl-CoA synthetase [Sphingobacteriales bacterium]|jgi:acetyl-CoA synthetase
MKNIAKSFPQYQSLYNESIQNPEKFWAQIAEDFQWHSPWDKVLEYDFDKADIKWFQGAKLNITENCLDRYAISQPDKTAILWEPNEPGESEVRLSYKELYEQVCVFSNVLLKHGVQKGDRVIIYMPMVPELAVAVLACARVGAVHSVVFAGFSAVSLSGRINDCEAKMLITADGVYRGAKKVDLKKIADEALEDCPQIKKVIVYRRLRDGLKLKEGRDVLWHQEIESVPKENTAAVMDAEDPLFILYTSGSTGKPKGLQHTCGGYMVYSAYTFRQTFGYKEDDVYWCTADIGWITGHSYIIYGPLLSGATTLMFEGIPTFPDAGRFWDVVEKHRVTLFYTAPTAIRSLMASPDSLATDRDLSSLRVLGTVGEPINEEAWNWYDKVIGKGKCPIVDTYWQTETGGFMISPIAHVTPTKPTFATLPLPGIQPTVLSPEGKELFGNNIEGALCVKFPWPGMARTIYGDHQRFIDTYFSAFKGHYFTGDGCKKDDDGYYRITGRMDDVIIVSGHNLGTAEIEDAINMHPNVIESAVVGFPHDIKGNGIMTYVITDNKMDANSFEKEIRDWVAKEIGPIAKPDRIVAVNGLPKTRSGKIMRRILRKLAIGESDDLGDVSTLLNPECVDELKAVVLNS